jgi:uncharacterized protein (DUF169 family)
MLLQANAKKIKDMLGMELYPIGLSFADSMPDGSLSFKESGGGCMMPLVFSAAKGKTVSFDSERLGWPCTGFYLGYKEWIFEGIECYLSNEEVYGREPERFVKSKEQAKKYVESFIPKEINTQATIFKPLENYSDTEKPELAIFFVNPDQLSALNYLIYFNKPERTDLISSGFLSACGAIATLPLKLKREGEKKAVWGMHDISARSRLPKDLFTITMPIEMFDEICDYLDDSFLVTSQWAKILERNKK